MVFSSSLFIFYFLPLALLAYYLSPIRFRNIIIVACSLFFYAWGAPKYVFMILATMMIDFFAAKMIHRTSGTKRKMILAAGLSINIGLLLFFKYANFFVENLNTTLSLFDCQPVTFFSIALPVGISFFTFHEISYLIDIYRSDKEPLNNPIDYAVYILFFPQLIAGPIIRFNEIADQIKNRTSNETFDNRLTGFLRFIIGLAKKVLIANVMGQHADLIFSQPIAELSTLSCWIGALAYTMQIYFDFSGYSDMAIGIARMMGFVFPENFQSPYTSRNISEFWTRWHISLGRWMRDYLYISLGGNRVKTKARLYFNLSFVFLISGFWHGAAWTFVIWGAFHGLFLILDRVFLVSLLDRLGKVPSILFCFLVTTVGWVIFRAETLTQAFSFVKKMFSFEGVFSIETLKTQFIVVFIIALFFSFLAASKKGNLLEHKIFYESYTPRRMYIMSIVCLCLFIVSIGNIISSDFNPFIYFRF